MRSVIQKFYENMIESEKVEQQKIQEGKEWEIYDKLLEELAQSQKDSLRKLVDLLGEKGFLEAEEMYHRGFKEGLYLAFEVFSSGFEEK